MVSAVMNAFSIFTGSGRGRGSLLLLLALAAHNTRHPARRSGSTPLLLRARARGTLRVVLAHVLLLVGVVIADALLLHGGARSLMRRQNRRARRLRRRQSARRPAGDAGAPPGAGRRCPCAARTAIGAAAGRRGGHEGPGIGGTAVRGPGVGRTAIGTLAHWRDGRRGPAGWRDGHSGPWAP